MTAPVADTEPCRSTDPAVRAWYEANAGRFAQAPAIEIPFLGLDPEARERLDRFKLSAIASGRFLRLEGRNVLDFGAGHGRLALAFPGMASYTGVDLSPALVRLGNERLARAGLAGRARLVHGDVTTYPVGDARFDVVCSLGMLPYLPDPVEVLRRMARHLRPGGALCVDIRCASRLYAGLRRLKWALRRPTGGITYLARPEVIEAALRAAGFTEVQVVPREFPLLAALHARSGWRWPVRLRDALAARSWARPLATEAWIFACRRVVPGAGPA